MLLRRNALNTAMAAALGLTAGTAATPATADSIVMSFTGAFTMLSPSGKALDNTDGGGAPFYQGRTPFSGNMTYDLDTESFVDFGGGFGYASLPPFSFFGGGNLTINIWSPFVGIGDGFGNPGTLMLGNMYFDWVAGSIGFPASVVLDAQGLLSVLTNGFTEPASVSNVTMSQTIASVGALAASENTTFGTTNNNYTIPLGPVPIATTTWNTTNIGQPTLGTYPSGTLPLIADTIGGSPFQQAVPFNGFSPNFDFTSLTITEVIVSEVPVPAAVWLFGSGLAGLLGVARCSRDTSAGSKRWRVGGMNCMA